MIKHKSLLTIFGSIVFILVSLMILIVNFGKSECWPYMYFGVIYYLGRFICCSWGKVNIFNCQCHEVIGWLRKLYCLSRSKHETSRSQIFSRKTESIMKLLVLHENTCCSISALSATIHSLSLLLALASVQNWLALCHLVTTPAIKDLLWLPVQITVSAKRC